jgi:hypothetical protein
VSYHYKKIHIYIGFSTWKKLFTVFNINASKKFFFIKKNDVKIFSKLISKHKNYKTFIWGYKCSDSFFKFFKEKKIRINFVEDGFIRSFKLGSDLSYPYSIVVDDIGIYYDASRKSGIEFILDNVILSLNSTRKSRNLVNLIIKNKISKYNFSDSSKVPEWSSVSKKKILVIGQVKGDASIKYGTSVIFDNLQLLKFIRKKNNNSFIIYQPHPDVLSSNRDGYISNKEILFYANFIEDKISIINSIEACDEVHTMTSLSGFDALIRGKKVFTYGAPFYAGWGLTVDMDKSSPAFKRRKRKLTLEELVYGCLIKYPIYWDYEKNKKTTCVHVIKQIVKERDAYWRVNTKSPIEKPYLYRQFKRAVILAKSYFLLFIIFFLFLTNHSYADSISLFGGKSVDSNLIDFPKKAISNDLEIEQHKIIGIAYQQKIQTPVILGKANSHIEYIFANHSPKDLIETVIAYNIQTPSFAISSVHMRLGFSLGLSYVHGTPIFEDGTKEEPGKKYRLLNYNAYEVSLLDTEDKDSVFLRLHHRSGVYGLIAPQHVGSNFITIGLRKYF